MTSRNHTRVTVLGFVLLYLACMGSLVVLCTPFLEASRQDVVLFVMLPAAALGATLMTAAKLVDPDGSDRRRGSAAGNDNPRPPHA